ncbi:hypothetical protein PMAYCL1PPCAC_02620, partial [Pristionchus mayeri]
GNLHPCIAESRMADHGKIFTLDNILEIALNPVGSLSIRERFENDRSALIAGFNLLSPRAVTLILSPNGFRIIECLLNANDVHINVSLSESISERWDELEKVMKTVRGCYVCETLLSREVKAFAHKIITITPREWWFSNTYSLPVLIKAIELGEPDIVKEFFSDSQTEIDLCDSAEGLYCVLKVRVKSKEQPGWKTALKKLVLLKVKSAAGSDALVQVIVYGDLLAKDMIEIVCSRRESYDDETTFSFIIQLIKLSSVQMLQVIFNCFCIPVENPIICQIRSNNRFDEFKKVCDSRFSPDQRQRLDQYLASSVVESVDESLEAVTAITEQPQPMDTTTVDDGKNKKRKIDQTAEPQEDTLKKPRKKMSSRPSSTPIPSTPSSISTPVPAEETALPPPSPAQSADSTLIESSQSITQSMGESTQVGVSVSAPVEVFGPAPPPVMPVPPPVGDASLPSASTAPPPPSVSTAVRMPSPTPASVLPPEKTRKQRESGGKRVRAVEGVAADGETLPISDDQSQTSTSHTTNTIPPDFERIIGYLKKRADPGQHMMYMAMGEKYTKLINALETPTTKKLGKGIKINEFPHMCFRFIEDGLLALMMDENGSKVVKWFIIKGSVEHKEKIENIVMEAVDVLVESGECGRFIVRDVIEKCIDQAKKKEIRDKYQKAVLYPRAFSSSTPNSDDEIEITHEVIKNKPSTRSTVVTEPIDNKDNIRKELKVGKTGENVGPSSGDKTSRYSYPVDLRKTFDEIDANKAGGTWKMQQNPVYVENFERTVKGDESRKGFSDLVKERIEKWMDSHEGMNLVELLATNQSLRSLMSDPIASVLHRMTGTRGETILGHMLIPSLYEDFFLSCTAGGVSSPFAKIFHSKMAKEDCMRIGMKIAKGAPLKVRQFLISTESIVATEKGRLFIEALVRGSDGRSGWTDVGKLIPPVPSAPAPVVPPSSTSNANVRISTSSQQNQMSTKPSSSSLPGGTAIDPAATTRRERETQSTSTKKMSFTKLRTKVDEPDG